MSGISHFMLSGGRSNPASFITSSPVVNKSNPVVVRPIEVRAGDLMVFAGVSGSSFGSMNSSGWTLAFPPSGNDPNLTVFYKIATLSEPASYSVSNSNNSSCVVLLVYRNVNTISVFESGAAVKTGSGSVLTTNTLFSSIPNALVISFFGLNKSNTSWTTTPAGTTTRVIFTGNKGLLISDENQLLSGASTSRTATQSGTSPFHAVALAFRPA